MEMAEVVDLIGKSAGRLARAARLSGRDEKWWAFLAKEDWNLIRLSWELRGVILKRGETETELHVYDTLREQLEDILDKAEVEEGTDSV